MIFDFNKEIITYKDPDMSDEAISFYQLYFPDLAKDIGTYSENTHLEIRGETMCSLGWTFGVTNKNNDFISVRSYTKDMTVDEVDKFYVFREKYHSLANFCLIPKILNIWRGSFRGNGRSQGDYFDIFLNLVRDYYYEKELPSNVQEKFNLCKDWFSYYGVGDEGWKCLIDANYLNPFVNTDYTVKDLFANPEEFIKEEDAPIVGTYHLHYHPFPWGKKAPKECAMNFCSNSLYVWEQRTKLLQDNLKTVSISRQP
jgi:hypothetical protein